MSRRSVITVLTVILGITLGVIWSRRNGAPPPPPAVSEKAARPPVATPAASSTEVAATAGVTKSSATNEAGSPPEERIHLADGLNARGGTIQKDFQILQDVLIAWRSNYPQYGNPVGENNEITDLLTGNNSLHLALIPRDHPAVNADGELCDRWGTPFRFHQLSGDRMELRSAGPDKKFGTADDATFTP